MSGEYDDEIDDEEYGTVDNMHGAKIKKRVKGRRNKVAVVSGEGDNGHPPCPDGFDPEKWAKMSLEEKCKHLGIDVKEWLKMNREQQMQRMHNLAKNFKFYSMDKVAGAEDVSTSRKKWHL